MNLFSWPAFLPEGFENAGIIQRFWTDDYMVWGSISPVAGFLEKENSLETLIVIFKNFHQRVISDYMNMKSFEIPVLTENSRYLQTAALKFLAKRLLSLSPRLNDYSICNTDTSCPCKAYTTLRLWNMGTRTTVKKTHFDKSTIEQVHIKFCKQVLNVPWYTENTAWKAELGRYHLSIDKGLPFMSLAKIRTKIGHYSYFYCTYLYENY